jgi:hypothetical protein
MAGLKVTLDAALRARDVSRPTAAQESEAELALPDRLAVRRPPMSGQLPESGRKQSAAGPENRVPRPAPPRDNTPQNHPAEEDPAEEHKEKPWQPRPGRPLPRRGPGRRPAQPGATAEGTAGGSTAAAPDSSEQETTEPRDRGPRMRRRSRLGRPVDHASQDPSGSQAAE